MRTPTVLLATSLISLLISCDAYHSNKISVSHSLGSPHAAPEREAEIVSAIKSTLRELGMEPSPGDTEGRSWSLHHGKVHVDIEVAKGMVVANIEQVRGGIGYGPTDGYRRTRDALKQRLQAQFGESEVALR